MSTSVRATGPLITWAAQITDACTNLLGQAAKLCLLAIVLGVTLDAICRYLLGSPIQGTHAIVEGLLQPAVVFLGAGLAARSGSHLRVDVLPIDWNSRFGKITNGIFSWLICAFWTACAWQTGAAAYDAYANNQWPVGEIAVPMVISYGMTSLGCAVAAVAHVAPMVGAVSAGNHGHH